MKDIQLILKRNYLLHLEDNPYTCVNKFSFIYEPIKESKIKLEDWMEQCREVVCDRIRTLFYELPGEKTFDVKKLRLITHTKFLGYSKNMKLSKQQKSFIEKRKIEYVNEMSTSIKILNLVEKEFKWPLTKIYLVKCKKVDDYNNTFYYFEGSKKWVKSPNLFSLFMLFLRIGPSLKKHTKFRTLDGFYRCLKKNPPTVDINCLKIHYKRGLLAVKHYNRLFGKPSMRELYLPNKDLGQFSEGLNTLCDLDTNNLDLRVKFARILNEEGMLKHWEKCKLIREKE